MASDLAARVSFYDAQGQHRRTALVLSVVCVLAVAVLAAAASLALSPFVIVLAAALVRLVDLAVPVPGAVWDQFRIIVTEFTSIESVLRHWPIAPAALPAMVPALVRLVVPGIVAILAVWFAVWRLMISAASMDLPAAGLAEPDPHDPEQRQLCGIVEGVAIAAGMPLPRIRLLDEPGATAGVRGLHAGDATLIVSRGLLHRLARGETEAVVAHLFAWIADGDLGLHVLILSVANTFAMLTALLDAPLSATARRTLSAVAGTGIRRLVGRSTPADRETLTALLADRVPSGGIAEIGWFIDDADRPVPFILRPVLVARFVVLLPLYFAGLLPRVLLFPIVLLLIGPLLTGMARSRRLLADAGAVQLSRDPDALARALMKLEEEASPAGPEAGPELEWMVRRPLRGSAVSLWFVGTHPRLTTRLRQLRRLGSTIDPTPDTGGPTPVRSAPPAVGGPGGTGRPAGPLGLLVAIPVVLIAVLLAVVALLAGAQFFLYMFSVALLAAALMIGGLFLLAIHVVVLLLP